MFGHTSSILILATVVLNTEFCIFIWLWVKNWYVYLNLIDTINSIKQLYWQSCGFLLKVWRIYLIKRPSNNRTLTFHYIDLIFFYLDLSNDVSQWSVSDVVQYFESTQDCQHIAPLLHEQEVDGMALLLLSHHSLTNCLGIKLGPALKVSDL